jgi:DNA-binding MarR family transcriptional regulator
MKKKLDSSASDLANAMVALVRAFGLHRPNETPCGAPVPVAEAHAIMDLAAAGPMNHGQLAVRLRLEKSTVSRLARQLEKRNWIERTSAKHDRRVVQIRLTAAGKRAAKRLAAARHSKFDELLAAIPQQKRRFIL